MLRKRVRFEVEKYLYSSRIIAPIVLYFIYLVMSYSVKPQNFTESMGVSGCALFWVMLAVGVMYDDVHYTMAEQAVLVKCRHKEPYYLGRVLSVFIISAAFAFLGILYPMFVQITNQFSFFNQRIRAIDLISGFLLLFVTGFSGGVSGLFFNKRIFKKRSYSTMIAMIIGIMVAVKKSLIQDFPVCKFILWIFPPINDLCSAYSLKKMFYIENTWIYFLWIFIYCLMESVLYVKVMVRRGVE